MCFAHAFQLAILDVLYLRLPGNLDEKNEIDKENIFVTGVCRDEEEPQDFNDGGIQNEGEITFIRKNPVSPSLAYVLTIKKIAALCLSFGNRPSRMKSCRLNANWNSENDTDSC